MFMVGAARYLIAEDPQHGRVKVAANDSTQPLCECGNFRKKKNKLCGSCLKARSKGI